MKIETILQASFRVALLICALGFLTSMPEAQAMVRPAPEPRPDLTIVAAVYKDPNVAVRVRNAGDAAAPASTLAVLLLKNTDPDTKSPVAFQFPLPALAQGQMIEKTFNIGSKSFTNNGALAVKVDYKNQIPESDERNNQKHVVLYQAPLLPDLVIQSVEIIDDKANIYVFNKCKGTSAKAYLSMNVYKGADKKSGSATGFKLFVPSLLGGTGKKFVVDPTTYTPPINVFFSGKYIRVEVDEANEIKEAVETNNWWETGAAPFPDPANSCDSPK